jgi:hypothetical protein
VLCLDLCFQMTQTPENPRMISARRTESLDAPNISSLITSSTETLFGRTNIVNLMYVNKVNEMK